MGKRSSILGNSLGLYYGWMRVERRIMDLNEERKYTEVRSEAQGKTIRQLQLIQVRKREQGILAGHGSKVTRQSLFCADKCSGNMF